MSTNGVNASYPVSLASNSSGECGLLCSGFEWVVNHNYPTVEEPGQILFRIYDRSGKRLTSDTLNGDGNYYATKPPYVSRAFDFGTSLIAKDSQFILALSIDRGKSLFQEYQPFKRQFFNELRSFSTSKSDTTLSQQDKLFSGHLALWDTTLIEVGRYIDSGYYVEWFNLAGDSLRQGLISPSTGIDSIYALAADNDGSVYLAATLPTDIEWRNTSLLHVSPSGKLLWQRTFDGLGSGDDIPVKLIVDHGFAYVLVQSADTNGNDWVLLKYDSTGKQLFRLRYDGAGHGDDVPRDFAIGSGGAIYVVGGSTNAKGVQQFTVVKYVDSVLAAIEPTAPIARTIDAHLSSNPWSTTTTLEIRKSPASRVTVRVLDLLGREYLNRTTTSNAVSLNSSQFPRGFYTIAIEDASGSRKLVKFIRE